VDAAKAERMTSNRFLSAVAEPSEVEAQIGRTYERQGLEAAFQLIEQMLIPLFEKQERRRTDQNAGGRRTGGRM
jgi:hypothetical protein